MIRTFTIPLTTGKVKIKAESLDEALKKATKNGALIECADCPNEFKANEIRPCKYEPETLVCEQCHDERMEDE